MFALVHEGLRLRKLGKFQPLQEGGGVVLIFFMLLFSTLLSLSETFNEQDKGLNPHLLAHTPSLIHPQG